MNRQIVSVLAGALLAVSVLVVACGDDETATSSPSTSTVSATTVASPTGTVASAGYGDALASADVVAQFPPEVQDLVKPLPDNVARLLLEVRQEGPQELVWQDGSGGETLEGMKRAFMNNWEKITGWTLNPVWQGDAWIQTFTEKMSAGQGEWDVAEIGEYGVADNMNTQGFFEPIDTSYFPTEYYVANLVPSDADAYAAPLSVYGTVLLYNKEVFVGDKAPTKVSDIFDPAKFPGARCLYDGAQYGWNLEFALMADGVPFSEVYDTLRTKEGRDRAFARLDTIKDDIIFWGSGAESVQFVLDGQCDIGTTWNGRPANRVRDEPTIPFAISWDQAILTADPFAIPKGAKHPKAALSVLAYAMWPGSQCNMLNELAYGQSMDLAPFPDCLTDFSRTWGPKNDLLAGSPDASYYNELNKEITDEWAAWKVGQ